MTRGIFIEKLGVEDARPDLGNATRSILMAVVCPGPCARKSMSGNRATAVICFRLSNLLRDLLLAQFDSGF